MQALLLAGAAPQADDEFLYAPATRFAGLAGEILTALEIPAKGRAHGEVLVEFQKRGLHLAYALECPMEAGADASFSNELLERHLPQVITRIRRSLKPKRVVLVSPELQAFLPQLSESSVGCPVFYAPFADVSAFRGALSALSAHGT